MTKSNVTKLFMGSLIAIVAGVFVVALGFIAALASGTFVMEGPDVTGFQLSSSAPAAFGLAFFGLLGIIGGAIGQFAGWIGAVVNTVPPRGQDLVRRAAGARTPELRLHRDGRLHPGRAGRHRDDPATLQPTSR